MNDTIRELLGLDNHYKLVATLSWLFGLAGDAYFILHGGWSHTFILSWTALTFVAPYGLKGLTAWLRTRGGGTVDTLADEMKAKIEARRNGDFEAAE